MFWVNPSTPHDLLVFSKLAQGLSEGRVEFSGVIKSGVAELMAVQHRRARAPELGMRTAMLGIVSDTVMRR